MSVAVARRPLPMNVPEFLGFLRSRPDEERWELIALSLPFGAAIRHRDKAIAHP
jgi:hypothetical protein